MSTRDTSGTTGQPPEPPTMELDALALTESLAETRAGGGDSPRLSDLLAAWPGTSDKAVGAITNAALAQHEELADTHAAQVAFVVGDDAVDAMVRGPFSVGTQRALDRLFGGQMGANANANANANVNANAIVPETYQRAETLARVAETTAAYTANQFPRLLELAAARGLGVEALAAQIFLSVEVIDWLDAVALPRTQQPDALVVHLVGALRIEREVVCRALARGDGATEAGATSGDVPGDVPGRILATPSLTTAQRAYWQDMLASDG